MASRALIVAQIERLTGQLANEEMRQESATMTTEQRATFVSLHADKATAEQSLLLMDAAFRYGLAEARDYATADVIAAATYRDYQRADEGTRAAIARTEQRRQLKDRRAFQVMRNAHV